MPSDSSPSIQRLLLVVVLIAGIVSAGVAWVAFVSPCSLRGVEFSMLPGPSILHDISEDLHIRVPSDAITALGHRPAHPADTRAYSLYSLDITRASTRIEATTRAPNLTGIAEFRRDECRVPLEWIVGEYDELIVSVSPHNSDSARVFPHFFGVGPDGEPVIVERDRSWGDDEFVEFFAGIDSVFAMSEVARTYHQERGWEFGLPPVSELGAAWLDKVWPDRPE